MKHSQNLASLLCAAVMLAFFSSSLAEAGTFVWTGGGANNNWTTGNNWQGGVAPSSGNWDDLIFPGAGASKTTGSATYGWNVGSITFSAGSDTYSLGSGGFNMGAGGITNSSSSLQTFNHQMTLSADQTWTAANGGLAFNSSYMAGNNKNLTLAGGGSISIAAQMGNIGTLGLTGSGDRSFTNSISAATINVGNSGTTTFSGGINATAININGDGNVVFSGTINSGALTLNGTGTTTITGNSNSGTPTVVNGGTLVLAHNGGTAINNSLTVNDGGTVRFEADNQVPHNQTVTLNSGATVVLNNTSQLFANLDINGDVTIDFGAGKSEFKIQDWGNISIENGIVITIVNWTEGDVFQGADPGENVVHIQYADSFGTIYANGTWDGGLITPDGSIPAYSPIDSYSPVPEPADYALILLGGTFFVLFLRRSVARFVRAS